MARGSSSLALLALVLCTAVAAVRAGAAEGQYQGYAIGVADGFQEVPTGNAYYGLVWTRLAKEPATAIVASHFHGPHEVLNSAGIRITLPAEKELTAYRVAITADQYAAFTRNSYYYNLHTSAYPDGEIRANLIWYTGTPPSEDALGAFGSTPPAAAGGGPMHMDPDGTY
eukprot:tig00000385_g24753.t1